MIIPVRLTAHELMMASAVGLRRHVWALAHGSRARFPERYPGELWNCHIEGACAEYAVAKCHGWCWSGHVNTFHQPDFVIDGDAIEVRWSTTRSVKVRPDDNGVIVVAVSGQAPEMRIMGAIAANDAKTHREWYCETEPDCWFIPFTELRPLDELRRKESPCTAPESSPLK